MVASTAMNPTSASQPSSRTSSTPASTSTLRPRTARLISSSDDELGDFSTRPSPRLASPRDSPFVSRSGSPAIPSKYPSRTSPADRPRRSLPRKEPSLLDSLGGSWTAIQGLASNVLGGEVPRNGRSGVAAGKRPAASLHRRAVDGTRSPGWGISSSAASIIAAGSSDEHGAKVRDAKRKDLLRANGQVYPDIGGNFKRRTSDDASASGSVDATAEEEGDALVYVHHVQVADTMAGVALRYNCEVPVIRKANRMWPNDHIQVQKTIVLPVDACGVKGKLCDAPNAAQVEKEEDLLGDDTEALSMYEGVISPFSSTTSNNQPSRSSQEPSSTESQNASPSVNSTNAEVPPWKHDSWVLLPGFSTPIEIARLPRRHLGFFPRARRKSNTYSDLGTNTPKTSLDFSRTASSPASTSKVAASPRTSVNTNRSSLAPPSSSSSRRRSNSQPFVSLLHGPGGVGTLDRTAMVPGPAQDPLNRILGPHLPNVEPPAYQTVYTPWLTPAEGDLDELISVNNYRRRGVGVEGWAGMEWQDVGGAIENWIRRTAKKAATALESSSSGATKDKGAAAVGAGSGLGDLIELVDSFEAVDEGQEESGQGNLLYMGLGGSSCMGSSGSAVGSEGRDGVRGRSMGRSMGKSGKAD